MIKENLNKFGKWLADKTEEPVVTKEVDKFEEAVKKAYLLVGFPEHLYGPEYDLIANGKLIEVYTLAARELGTDPELRTVGDIIKWLKS